jgi:hypothetical protein
MTLGPILDLPLNQILRAEIAMSLQQVMGIYTVGQLFFEWRDAKKQKSIVQLFDSPEQARHCLAICSHWLGVRTPATHKPIEGWWPSDEGQSVSA